MPIIVPVFLFLAAAAHGVGCVELAPESSVCRAVDSIDIDWPSE